MAPVPDLVSQGTASQLTRNGGVVLLLWIASGVAAVFMLYLVIYPLVEWYRRRRAVARSIQDSESEEPPLHGSSIPVRNDYLETACNHCQTTVFVAKVRRFKPFFCPNCGQTNPPLKKETMPWTKRILRRLLYPSFQHLF